MKDVIPQRTEEIVIEAAWQVDRASWPGCLVLMISPYPPFGLDFDIVEQIGGNGVCDCVCVCVCVYLFTAVWGVPDSVRALVPLGT